MFSILFLVLLVFIYFNLSFSTIIIYLNFILDPVFPHQHIIKQIFVFFIFLPHYLVDKVTLSHTIDVLIRSFFFAVITRLRQPSRGTLGEMTELRIHIKFHQLCPNLSQSIKHPLVLGEKNK